MQNKDITFSQDADFKKIKDGVDKLANVVKSTLGPGGTNVILQLGHTYGITKDGVSVAREIFLEDPLENTGAQIVKAVAQKTVDEAGDGTTTATVLAQAILSEGVRHSAAGAKAIDVKRGIDIAVANVVKKLRALSRDVKTEDINKIAIISANGDLEIGNLVGDAVGQVGLEGMVTVEDSKSLDTYSKKVDGMRWDRGYMSAHFITNKEKAECVLENPVILIYDGNINTIKEIMGGGKANILDRYRNNPESDLKGLPLLIIANEYGADAISTMSVNHVNGALQCCLVNAPDFENTRKQTLYDIAAMTGATVISKETGHTWADVKPEHLGRCERVRVTQWTTTIIGGQGGLRATTRAQELREQMKETNDFAYEIMKRRLARLVNGLMVIYVGGGSEIEVKEKKDRIDDAINATRAAIEEGILPGGGTAYIRAGQNVLDDPELSPDQAIGFKIVKLALKVPFLTICDNVGEKGEIVLNRVIGQSSPSYGFNAASMQYEDLIDAGVIDPTKVVRLALENAASVAGMLLTTKAAVLNRPTK